MIDKFHLITYMLFVQLCMYVELEYGAWCVYKMPSFKPTQNFPKEKNASD